MKKLLSLILALAMALTVLSGCGGSTTASSSDASGGETESKSGYPKFAITINTSKAGSTVDIFTRLFAKYANNHCAESFVVNSTAGQVEAARETLSAEPDGYTLCMTNTTVIINDVVGETDFNAIDDFDLIGIAIDNASNWLCVKTEFAEANNIKTMTDLYNYTQEHPDELMISDRLASGTNVVCQQLKEAGFRFTSADVGTATDRLTNFLAGNVDVAIISWSMVEQYVQTGEVTCLALCGKERSKFTPDIPTSYEEGFEVASPTSYYLYGPKGMPQEVIDYLEKVMNDVVTDEAFIADCEASSVEAHKAQTVEEAAAELSATKQEMISLGLGEGYQG